MWGSVISKRAMKREKKKLQKESLQARLCGTWGIRARNQGIRGTYVGNKGA
jgi:hypothetical protein